MQHRHVHCIPGPAHCAEIKSGKICESALDVIKSAAEFGLNVDYAKVAWSEPGKQTVTLDEVSVGLENDFRWHKRGVDLFKAVRHAVRTRLGWHM